MFLKSMDYKMPTNKTCLSILMYHQIGTFQPMVTHRSTYCHYKRFRNQMLLLRFLGYKTIDMDKAISALKDKDDVTLPARTVVLTFDDGYENFYQYAYPCLKKHNFSAIVYVLAGYLGRSAEWFAADKRPCPPLMDISRLKALHKEGIQFGSHGINHLKLAEIPYEKAREEIIQSKKILEQQLGFPINHFCYPYGSYNVSTMKAVKEAGYHSAVSCVRGRACEGDDLYQLPRKAISYGDSLIGFAWKLLCKNKRKTQELTYN